MTPRPFHSALTIFLLCLTAQADTIKLKNGETIKGDILKQDDQSITIEFEARRGIKDEKTLLQSEILGIEKDDPAEKSWLVLSKDHPTADLLSLGDYDRLIAKAETFLSTHSRGPYATKARQLIESLRAEKARVSAGDMKLDGQWISASMYQREKFWVDGTIALKRMTQSSQSNRYLEALRQYENIESTYGGTTIHAKAIGVILPMLKRYAGVVNEAIVTQPLLIKQRITRLNTLTDSDRRATEAAQIAEDTEYLAKIEEEKKSGSKWMSLSPFNLEELQNALTTIEAESARIAAIDTKDSANQENLLRQIDQAIGEGRLASANTLLTQASASLKNSPYLKSLQDRVKSEVTRISEEKKISDAAMQEAARLANAKSPKKPSNNTSNDEPDPIKEGTSPLAKAVLGSSIGKNANKQPGDSKTIAPENEESTPTNNPPEKTAPESRPKTDVPEEKPSVSTKNVTPPTENKPNKEASSPASASTPAISPAPATTPADLPKDTQKSPAPVTTDSSAAQKPTETSNNTAVKPAPSALADTGVKAAHNDDDASPSKKATQSNPTVRYALYAAAGVLSLILVGLIAAPLFKRKPAEESLEESEAEGVADSELEQEEYVETAAEEEAPSKRPE